jgi:hypothetical protein
MNQAAKERVQTIYRHASSPKGEGLSTGLPSIFDIERGLVSRRKARLRKYFRRRLLQIKQKTLKELEQLDNLAEFFRAYEANELAFLSKTVHTEEEMRTRKYFVNTIHQKIAWITTHKKEYGYARQHIRALILKQLEHL